MSETMRRNLFLFPSSSSLRLKFINKSILEIKCYCFITKCIYMSTTFEYSLDHSGTSYRLGPVKKADLVAFYIRQGQRWTILPTLHSHKHSQMALNCNSVHSNFFHLIWVYSIQINAMTVLTKFCHISIPLESLHCTVYLRREKILFHHSKTRPH